MIDFTFDNKKIPVVILSLNHGDVEQELKVIKDAGFSRLKHVHGKYKGQLENSYVVAVRSPEEVDRLLLLARKYNQECIMFIDEKRDAILYYCDTYDVEPIGELVTVYEHLAHKQDSYTFCPVSNAYYVVKKKFSC